MIIGLGSVGTYLLDYLVSMNDEALKVVVVGRDHGKMEKNVNIVRVSSLIRGLNRTVIEIESDVDLNDINTIEKVIRKHAPDFIVNSSRAYPGLKYGSISWSNIRAYGIWAPLAIRFTKNLMEACDRADTNAVVINTSYSDGVIPWLRSCGRPYPDFGSGNLNHLIPRIKFAVADIIGIKDFWNVDVMFAASHFHDVCISKEGNNNGIPLPLKVYYMGKELDIKQDDIFSRCSISMPVDAQRNMMNASSNYMIIRSLIDTIRDGKQQKVFSPGFGGNIGGYPVAIGYRNGQLDAWIDESVFSFETMNAANRRSLAEDGIEDILDGKLIYTDALIEKTKKAFGKTLPKRVSFDEIEKTSDFLINEIILPNIRQ